MPYIAFEAGQLTADVKKKLIETLTETSAQITGIPRESFVISITERPDENIGVGGKTLKQIKNTPAPQ